MVVEPADLKNMSQNGNLPRIGVNIKKYLKSPPRYSFPEVVTRQKIETHFKSLPAHWGWGMRSSVLLNSCLTGIEISRDSELSWLLSLWPQISHQCNFTWINAQKTNENWKITVSLTTMAHGWCLKLKNLKFVKVKAFCNETRKRRHLAVCSSAFWGWKSSVTNIQAKAHALLIGHREVHHEPYPGAEEVAQRTICGMRMSNKWLRRPRKSIDCRQRTPMQFHLCQNCNEMSFFESTATPSSSIWESKGH